MVLSGRVAADPAKKVLEQLKRMLGREVPGAQYNVVNGQGSVFETALGVSDVATGRALSTETSLMAYSMTKAVTAVAVMQLVDKGTLSLDAALSDYFPHHPYGKEVTIRTLLAQTAGIPNPMPLDWFELEGTSFDRDEKLRNVLAKHGRLKHAPGRRYAYSNLSYWLLEKAVEAVTGRDFAEYVQAHVFAPLGISQFSASFSLEGASDLATGHSRRYSFETLVVRCLSPRKYWLEASGAFCRTARVAPHGRGYGGLFTNAHGLGAMLNDLSRETPRVLSRAAKELMFSQQCANGRPIDMTLGWVIGHCQGARYFGKQGGGLGFHGNLRIYPDRGIATVFLANRTELSPGPIDRRSDALDAAFLA